MLSIGTSLCALAQVRAFVRIFILNHLHRTSLSA